MPHQIISSFINANLTNPDANPKMNVTTIKCLQANQMITTHHVRHIFMPIDQTIEIIYLMQQFVKCNNSISSNQKGLLQDTSFFLQSILTLIVQTIVSVVFGAFSKQHQGALKVSL